MTPTPPRWSSRGTYQPPGWRMSLRRLPCGCLRYIVHFFYFCVAFLLSLRFFVFSSHFSCWLPAVLGGVSGATSTARAPTLTGFRVQGSGFRVQGSGFRVQGSAPTLSEHRTQGSGLRMQASFQRRIPVCTATNSPRRIPVCSPQGEFPIVAALGELACRANAHSRRMGSPAASPLVCGGVGVWGLGFGIWGLGRGACKMFLGPESASRFSDPNWNHIPVLTTY